MVLYLSYSTFFWASVTTHIKSYKCARVTQIVCSSGKSVQIQNLNKAVPQGFWGNGYSLGLTLGLFFETCCR